MIMYYFSHRADSTAVCVDKDKCFNLGTPWLLSLRCNKSGVVVSGSDWKKYYVCFMSFTDYRLHVADVEVAPFSHTRWLKSNCLVFHIFGNNARINQMGDRIRYGGPRVTLDS